MSEGMETYTTLDTGEVINHWNDHYGFTVDAAGAFVPRQLLESGKWGYFLDVQASSRAEILCFHRFEQLPDCLAFLRSQEEYRSTQAYLDARAKARAP